MHATQRALTTPSLLLLALVLTAAPGDGQPQPRPPQQNPGNQPPNLQGRPGLSGGDIPRLDLRRDERRLRDEEAGTRPEQSPEGRKYWSLEEFSRGRFWGADWQFGEDGTIETRKDGPPVVRSEPPSGSAEPLMLVPDLDAPLGFRFPPDPRPVAGDEQETRRLLFPPGQEALTGGLRELICGPLDDLLDDLRVRSPRPRPPVMLPPLGEGLGITVTEPTKDNKETEADPWQYRNFLRLPDETIEVTEEQTQASGTTDPDSRRSRLSDPEIPIPYGLLEEADEDEPSVVLPKGPRVHHIVVPQPRPAQGGRGAEAAEAPREADPGRLREQPGTEATQTGERLNRPDFGTGLPLPLPEDPGGLPPPEPITTPGLGGQDTLVLPPGGIQDPEGGQGAPPPRLDEPEPPAPLGPSFPGPFGDDVTGGLGPFIFPIEDPTVTFDPGAEHRRKAKEEREKAEELEDRAAAMEQRAELLRWQPAFRGDVLRLRHEAKMLRIWAAVHRARAAQHEKDADESGQQRLGLPGLGEPDNGLFGPDLGGGIVPIPEDGPAPVQPLPPPDAPQTEDTDKGGSVSKPLDLGPPWTGGGEPLPAGHAPTNPDRARLRALRKSLRRLKALIWHREQRIGSTLKIHGETDRAKQYVKEERGRIARWRRDARRLRERIEELRRRIRRKVRALDHRLHVPATEPARGRPTSRESDPRSWGSVRRVLGTPRRRPSPQSALRLALWPTPAAPAWLPAAL